MPGKNISILIVEDAKTFQIWLSDVLEAMNYDVIGIAENAADAIDLVDECRPDLVLMDINLEGDIDGIECATIVKKEFGVPVVFLTAMTDEAFFERAKISNPYGYVLKSADEKEIHLHIQVALNIHKLSTRVESQNHRFNLIAQNVKDILWIYDLEINSLSMVSQAFDSIFETPSVGLKRNINAWNKFIHPDDKNAIRTRTKELSHGYEIEYRIRRSSGVSRWLHEKTILVDDVQTGTKILIGITTDITDRILREQLNNEKIKLDLRNKMQGMIMSNLSHEIRTPLNGILGMLDHLMNNGKLTEEDAEFVRIANASSKNLLSIVNDMLDLSSIESGKSVLAQHAISINQIFDSVIEIQTKRAQQKGLELKYIVGEGVPDMILTDEVKLKQIVRNLISNAIKFTFEGIIVVELAHRLSGEQERLDIKVIDQGIGISPEQQETIFNEFQQVENEVNQRGDGTGLGLAIVRDYVQLFGGEVGVNSTEGRGSEFWISIPIDIYEGKKLEEKEIDFSVQYPLNVLLVEDKKVNQMVATMMLKGFGASVDIAENGQIALDAIDRKKYDLILMDIKMPVMDGIEATKRMKEQKLDTPIIGLSANALDSDKEHYISEGMDDYMSKPVDKKTLYLFLKQVYEKSFKSLSNYQFSWSE